MKLDLKFARFQINVRHEETVPVSNMQLRDPAKILTSVNSLSLKMMFRLSIYGRPVSKLC